MFEDSTFESTGRIRTRSGKWMIAALLLNGSVLLALVLIPLIYPEALPQRMRNILLAAPPAPVEHHEAPQPKPQTARSAALQLVDGHMFAPRVIPATIIMLTRPEALPAAWEVPGADLGPQQQGIPGGFPNRAAVPQVRPEVKGPAHISSGVAAGLLIHRVTPNYPPIGVAMRAEGTVVLQAMIAKDGTIINLRVVSGPAILQQAAMDAVKQWRYRPYLLDGGPVEVETTINVVFSLNHG